MIYKKSDIEKMNISKKKIFENRSDYLVYLRKNSLLLKKEHAEQIGKPVEKTEQPAGFVYLVMKENQPRYEALYDRTGCITYIPYDAKPEHYALSSWCRSLNVSLEQKEMVGYTLTEDKLLPLYNLKALLKKKGLEFFPLSTINPPHFLTQLFIQCDPSLRDETKKVGYTHYSNEYIKVYQTTEKHKMHTWKEYKNELEIPQHEDRLPSTFHESEKNLEPYVTGYIVLHMFSNYRPFAKIYNMEKIAEKYKFIFFKSNELSQAMNYSLFTINEMYLFPKHWGITSFSYERIGFEKFGKEVYQLNEKGKKLFKLISDENVTSSYLVVSILKLEEVQAFLRKERNDLKHLKLLGVTQKGEYVFDLNSLKNKEKLRLRLLTISR